MYRRLRRAGSRTGTLSPQFKEALRAEAVRLGALGDSVEAIREVGDFYAQLDFDLEQVADVRLDALRRLRALGWTYDRISDATGLSKPRVAQLARTASVGGRRI